MAAPGGQPGPPGPSPFVGDDPREPLLPAGSGTATDGPAAAAAKLGWEDAFEECTEVPAIATQLSATLSSFTLAHHKPPNLEAEEVANLKADDGRCGAAGWGAETRNLLRLALPIALSNAATFIASAIGVSFVGRLGGLQLSAAVLAQSVFNVTGMSAMMGFTGTVDTLCGQAWGAKNYRAFGLIVQRALLVNTAFSLLIMALWLKSETLFLALGQVGVYLGNLEDGSLGKCTEPELSAVAARYMRLLSPSLPCLGIAEALKRSLLAQRITAPNTAVNAVIAALSPLFNWLLIVRLGLGLDGAALAVVCLQATSLLLISGYVITRNARLRGNEQAVWHGWSREALRGWGQYLQLAIPSIIMICMKWWSFEALILMSGWLPDATLAVATMGVANLTNSVSFMVVFGVSMAASIRISNALGAGCPHSARRATFAALGLTMTSLAALVGALLVARATWVRLLTDVQPVIDATLGLVPLFAASMLLDGAVFSLSSLLRGSGRQKVGALANIVTYWILAIPLAHHLAFERGWGLHGLWTGALAANAVQACLMLGIALMFDYAGEARKAAARFALAAPLLADPEA